MRNGSYSKGGRQSGFSLLELTVVMAVGIIAASLAIPKVMSIVQNLRTSGDAASLNSAILLAKMTAAANAAHSRVHADFATKTFWVETSPSGISPTSSTTWTVPGTTGKQYLSDTVSFGYGSVSAPPSNTQASLAQAGSCSGAANTACIEFNSRGVPVDSTNAPTPNDAIYVTDGKSVTGVTVEVTGFTKIWRSEAARTNWKQR